MLKFGTCSFLILAFVASIIVVGCNNAEVPQKSKVSKAQADSLGEQMLWALVKDNDPEKAKELLKAGASPKFKLGNGASLLNAACMNGGHLDIVKDLVENGADVNGLGDDGTSVMYLAAQQSTVKIIEYLLDKGADIESGEGRYGTALIGAISKNNYEMVKMLIGRGASIHATSNLGFTATQAAFSTGTPEIMELFEKAGADKRLVNAGVLINAVKEGDLEKVQAMLDKGVDPNLVAIPNSDTALIYAVGGGFVDIVRTLLDHGADPLIECVTGGSGTKISRRALVVAQAQETLISRGQIEGNIISAREVLELLEEAEKGF